MNYLEKLAWEIFVLAGGSLCEVFEEDKPLYLGYAVLCLAKGEEVTNADIHDAWAANEIVNGNEKHKSLIPYNELSEDVQTIDRLYRDAVAKRAYLMKWERQEYQHKVTIIPDTSTVTIF